MYCYDGIEIGLGGRANPAGEDAGQSQERWVDIPKAQLVANRAEQNVIF